MITKSFVLSTRIFADVILSVLVHNVIDNFRASVWRTAYLMLIVTSNTIVDSGVGRLTLPVPAVGERKALHMI